MPVGDDTTIATRVRRRLGDLTPAERKVARELLGSYPIAGLEAVTALAERAQVSAPTVTRFATSLGFDGYRDFQRQLREEIHARMSSPLVRYQTADTQRSSAGQSPAGVLDPLAEEFTALVSQSFRGIPEASFEAVVELLAEARRPVLCLGGQLSQVVAHHLFDRLHQLRPGCRLLGQSRVPLHTDVLEVEAGDVLAVFDFRRYQPDVIAFARQAAGQGASVVLVTDRWLSPIADVADHVLTVESETSSPFDSLVAAIALVEVLVLALVGRLGEPGRDRMARLDALRRSEDWSPAVQEPHGALDESPEAS